MLTRRLLLAAPVGALTLSTAAVALTPEVTHEEAFALIKDRVDTALAPYAGLETKPLWNKEPDVVAEWLFGYRDMRGIFKTQDDFVRHKVQCFFYNRWVTDLLKEKKLVNEQGRFARSAQHVLVSTFPLELHQFDLKFTGALLMLNPKTES